MRAEAWAPLLLLAPALAGCAGPAGEPWPQVPVEPPPPGAAPADIAVTEFTADRAEGVLGDRLTLTARVVNAGGRPGEVTHHLRQNGRGIVESGIALAPGAERLHVIPLTLDEVGNVTYAFAHHAVTVRVRVPLDPPPPDTPGPGLPAQKRAPPLPGYAPRDLLAFDANASRVFERDLHGTRVALAVHHSVAEAGTIGGHPVVPAERLAEHLFATFDRAWHVFGGFPYATSTWVVAGLDDPCRFLGTTAAGARMCPADFATAAEPDAPPHAATEPMFREWFGHEVFHLWNGAAMVPQGSATGSVLGPESWFTEGVTVYYSARLSASEDDLAAYRSVLDTRWRTYQELQPRFPDRAFAHLAEASGPPPGPGEPPPRFGPEARLVYARGALVGLELDRWLAQRNASLDDVMRILYQDLVVSGERYTDTHLLGAIALASGDDPRPFFDAHVRGVTPLERPAVWVDHQRHRVAPDGRLP